MCENIICYLKLHSFLITNISLLLILGFSLLLYFKKMGEIHREWTFSKKLLNFFEGKVFILYFILLIISVLAAFNSVILNTKDLIPRDKIAESYGLIFSAIITVSGVFVGFYFNKKQTYKEIVTRERIEWLHKMQEDLAEFLALTSRNDLTNGDNDKLDRARELYYLIISNLNVKEDKKKKKKKKKEKEKEKENENERDAVELLYKYANSRGLDVELNFVRNVVDSDEDKDSNATKSIDELREENKKLKDQIKALEDKIKNLRKTEEVDPLAGLKRKEIISKYTEIFNETWNRIKDEADWGLLYFFLKRKLERSFLKSLLKASLFQLLLDCLIKISSLKDFLKAYAFIFFLRRGCKGRARPLSPSLNLPPDPIALAGARPINTQKGFQLNFQKLAIAQTLKIFNASSLFAYCLISLRFIGKVYDFIRLQQAGALEQLTA